MARIEKRRTKSGEVRYKAIIRRTGQPMKTRTFRTKSKALDWATLVEGEIVKGHRLMTAAEEQRTLSALVDAYREDVLNQRDYHTRRMRNRHLDWWVEKAGNRRLATLRRSDINRHLLALARGDSISGQPVSAATVNRYLATLRHALSYAHKELEWISENPALSLARTEPRGRVRYLDDAERERLLGACRASYHPQLYALVILALSTGARQGELVGLRWRDLDFGRSRAALIDTKNGESRPIYLAGAALEALRELSKVRRIDDDSIFASFPRKAWEGAVRSAQIEDFRFHDLRHSAASYLAMNGATLAEIAEVLGHKTLAVTQRYSHLADSHVAGVVEEMNRKFLSE